MFSLLWNLVDKGGGSAVVADGKSKLELYYPLSHGPVLKTNKKTKKLARPKHSFPSLSTHAPTALSSPHTPTIAIASSDSAACHFDTGASIIPTFMISVACRPLRAAHSRPEQVLRTPL